MAAENRCWKDRGKEKLPSLLYRLPDSRVLSEVARRTKTKMLGLGKEVFYSRLDLLGNSDTRRIHDLCRILAYTRRVTLRDFEQCDSSLLNPKYVSLTSTVTQNETTVLYDRSVRNKTGNFQLTIERPETQINSKKERFLSKKMELFSQQRINQSQSSRETTCTAGHERFYVTGTSCFSSQEQSSCCVESCATLNKVSHVDVFRGSTVTEAAAVITSDTFESGSRVSKSVSCTDKTLVTIADWRERVR